MLVVGGVFVGHVFSVASFLPHNILRYSPNIVDEVFSEVRIAAVLCRMHLRTVDRRRARVALVAQVAFVASLLIAASWQGPRYSVLAGSISDMYAVGAPNGAFLVVVLTLCGAATILFAALSLRPSLRPGGW